MSDATTRSRERYHEAERWAERSLPEEYAPFAASAALTLLSQGDDVTPEAVVERLRAQGRDAATMKAKGWTKRKDAS